MLVLNNENILSDEQGNVILVIWPTIAQNYKSGMKQRAIAIENMGSQGALLSIAESMAQFFSALDGSFYMKVGNVLDHRTRFDDKQAN